MIDIIPFGEGIDHELGKNTCHCNPTLSILNNDIVAIHNTYFNENKEYALSIKDQPYFIEPLLYAGLLFNKRGKEEYLTVFSNVRKRYPFFSERDIYLFGILDKDSPDDQWQYITDGDLESYSMCSITEIILTIDDQAKEREKKRLIERFIELSCTIDFTPDVEQETINEYIETKNKLISINALPSEEDIAYMMIMLGLSDE